MNSLYTAYKNGTDHWLVPRSDDNSLYSRQVDEDEGVLFRLFFDWSHEIKEDAIEQSMLQRK